MEVAHLLLNASPPRGHEPLHTFPWLELVTWPHGSVTRGAAQGGFVERCIPGHAVLKGVDSNNNKQLDFQLYGFSLTLNGF